MTGGANASWACSYRCADLRAIGARGRQYCGGFDLDFGALLEQVGDLHERHRRIVLTDDLAVRGAEFLEAAAVLALVGDVPRKPHEVLRLAAGRTQNGHDVSQRLAGLLEKIVRDELVALVPSDLPGNREVTAFRDRCVRIAARPRPAVRIDRLAHAKSPATVRSIPGSTRAARSASVNAALTTRFTRSE